VIRGAGGDDDAPAPRIRSYACNVHRRETGGVRPGLIPLLAALAIVPACSGPMAARQGGAQGSLAPVTIGIAAINDFHGALEPPGQSAFIPDGRGAMVGVPAGGAAWLASAVDSVRAQYAHTLTVSAGDLIGASQVASALYLDEPAIGVMNRIGLEFNAVGNHEFDRGRDELLRMQNGGCARHTARKPCQLERFAGAKLQFLSASTLTEDGATLFPASGIKRFGRGARQVSVGVIGLTLKGTPDLVSREGIAGLTFTDEADAINRAVPGLKAQGADAIVVLIHQGGRTDPASGPDGCDGLTGDIMPIAARLDPAVDVVVSGHTHWAYVCDYAAIDPARPLLLTSAGVYGSHVTDIALTIDPVTNRVISKGARNVVVQSRPYTASRGPVANSDLVPRFQPRADVSAYVARYVEAAKALAERPVGSLAGPAARRAIGDVDHGGPLGNLIADAQAAATGAQVAFMNPFGIRAPLTPAPDGSVTFGMIHAAQPFGNQLVTMTMTGADLKAVLEQGFADSGPEQFLTPSAGFAYRIDRAAAPGARVSGITLDGRPIDMAARYRVTVSDFLAAGGDGFSVFARQGDRVRGMTDIEALEAWLKAVPPRPVPGERRITEAR
jgi:5'-nucleotidase